MPLVARRKLNETWRDAVARRGRELAVEGECLALFDGLIAKGEHEAEAAYKSLASFGALIAVADGPPADRAPEI
jgi:hypothetical protein